MRASISLLLLLFAAAPAAAQDPARFFPLEEGNRWVWIGGDHDEPDSYFRLEVIGDTVIAGEPYALATATKLLLVYEPIATARCAVRVIPASGGYGSDVEALRVSGSAPCLPPAVGDHYGPDIGENGEPMTFEIGGISYDLEEVTETYQEVLGIGSGQEYFGAGVGPLLAFFNFNLSQGGGGYSSELVYAEVGDDEYGVEPDPAGELPVPERFYPLAAGDTWVYEYRSDAIGDVVERREVLRDTTIEGDAYALLAVERYDPDTYAPLDEALCAVRIDGGDLVWRAVEGECAVPEASFADAGWWVPLGLEQNVRADCTMTIGGFSYDFPFCFLVSYVPPPPDDDWYVSISFAVDVGLRYFTVVENGNELAHGLLQYARVGGEEYGEPLPLAAEPTAGVPTALAVEAAYPNPFRTRVAVAFAVPAPERVTVAAFDALGRRVWSRDLGRLPAGRHTFPLDGEALAPGVYVVRVTAGAEAVTARLVRTE